MRPLTLAAFIVLSSAAPARVEAPRPQLADGRYSDALTAAWTPDPRAVLHELEVDRLEPVPEQGTLLRMWDFSSLTNTSGNTRNLSVLDVSRAFADVGGTNLCLHAHAGGHLQIGKNKAAGMLVLPLTADEARTALMTLFRHGTDTDGKVTVGCVVGDGGTNVLAQPVLTLVPTVFAVPLPDEARTLVLKSRSTRRIRVRDIRLMTDYAAASATTNTVVRRRQRSCSHTAKNLLPGDYAWRVRSFDGGGTESDWSDRVAVKLDSHDGKFPVPGLLLMIR